MFSDSALKKIGCFVGGAVFGTVGVKILSSKDAKRYIQIVRQPRCGRKTAL